jgi:hypothetical protein
MPGGGDSGKAAGHGEVTGGQKFAHQPPGSLQDGRGLHERAEEFFSRMRRAEIGHHHHIAGAYLIRYAQEASWRDDHRRVDNGAQVSRVASLALAARALVHFGGYWQ